MKKEKANLILLIAGIIGIILVTGIYYYISNSDDKIETAKTEGQISVINEINSKGIIPVVIDVEGEISLVWPTIQEVCGVSNE